MNFWLLEHHVGGALCYDGLNNYRKHLANSIANVNKIITAIGIGNYNLPRCTII